MLDLPTGTVTFLFTDIEGSSRRWEHHPEAMRTALAHHDTLLRQLITAHGGVVFKMVGDAVYAAFAVAADAVIAALAAQRAMMAEEWGEVAPLRVRMALHTGAVQQRENDYFGPPLNRVARLLSAGYGGQVLLSLATVELARNALPAGVSVQDLGEHALKDLLRPEHVFQFVSADLPSEFPPLKTLSRRLHNLPLQPTPFIGREREAATVVGFLRREEVRLLTLTGPGGVGKTRLGLQVAAELSDDFTDGVFFVNLTPISDPEFVVPTIAQALGLREVAGQPLLEHLKGELQQKQLLLLLDNFEQVVSAVSQVTDLLAVCPKLKVLVTSREVLHVRAEHEFAVPSLALPDPTHLPELAALSHYAAVALFLQQAQAVKPDFNVTPVNARAIAEICVRLDGLPLAIELAAVRIKLLPPQALLARLGQRLAVLTGGAKDVPARQQTLRNTIEWSYQLLDAAEQRLFRCLSVFVNGCTLEAAEAVCGAGGDASDAMAGSVLDGVASLIDKSLLQQPEQERDEPRLVMLETIREYGLEVLAACGEMEAIRQAHAEFYLRLAKEAEPGLKGPQQAMWLARLEREQDNLRAALSWFIEHGEAESALHFCGSLWWFWRLRGYWSEGRRWSESALGPSRVGEPTVARARALWIAGDLAYYQDDYLIARSLLEESVMLCRTLGAEKDLSMALGTLGALIYEHGDSIRARPLLEQSEKLCRRLGSDWELSYFLRKLARYAAHTGELKQAVEYAQESLTLAQKLGDKSLIATTLSTLGDIAARQDELTQAIAYNQESLVLARELGDKLLVALALNNLGYFTALQGDLTLAAYAQEGYARMRELGDRTDIRKYIVKTLHTVGYVTARQGKLSQAKTWYREGLSLAQEIGSEKDIGEDLAGLAMIAAAEGQLLQAAYLFGAVEARLDIHLDMYAIERAEYNHAVEGVRRQLGRKAFAAAHIEGFTMTPEQVLAIPRSPAIVNLPPSHKYPDNLTEREVQVLCLVAKGLTDAQIAEQLVLSLHTVHAHLRTIYSKLGVTSRSAATRYAFEHQLV